MNRESFSRVLVIGTGLIGGSLTARIRESVPGCWIAGLDREPDQAQILADRGYLDRWGGPAALEEEARQADLIVLAAPPSEILEILPAVAESSGPDSIVTDVASVKSRIVMAAHRAFGRSAGRFVGGHPMAGSELSGARNASADLLARATWCLVPLGPERGESVDRLRAFLESLTFRVLLLDASTHDRIVAVTSHLPYIMSTALSLVARAVATDHREAPLISGGAFRDATRVAASDPGLWDEILRFNRPAVLEALERLADVLGAARSRMEAGGLEEFLAHARAAALAWKETRGE